MAAGEDRAERALRILVTRVPGAGVLALVILLYGGGLAVPLLFHWSVVGLVELNVIATVFAGLVGLTWVVVQLEARDRRHLVEWTTDLRKLTAEEFEWLVGEVFRREGWTVQETGSQSRADGNIDLRLTRGNERVIAQCKRWTSQWVGVDEIRKFGGTLMREGLLGSGGIFITLSDFHEQARTEAEKLGIALVDRLDLYARMEKVRRTEPCPVCQAPMVLSRSSRGWWLRCVAPGCKGKLDLGSEPGRAFDFLTRSS